MLFRKKISKNKLAFKYSSELFAVSAEDTTHTALEIIRNSKLSGNFFYCYVTDNEGKLVGVVPLRKLITTHKETKISDIMIRNPIRLTTQTSFDIVLEYFILYKFLAFPVVDENGKLVGIARANDFMEDTVANEQNAEQVRDDLLKIIGIQLEEFRKPTIIKSTFLRFPYLLFNISSGLICAFITKLFNRTIDEFIFIAFFITIILGLAESIGTQSVAVTLSCLEKTIKLKRFVIYEVLVGAKIGFLCGGLLYAVSLFWLGNQNFSLVLFLTILLTLINASFLGCSLPLLFKKIGINPAHASCPMVLAIADIISLTSYFSLGTYMLSNTLVF
jgi:magnesium transporter